MTTIKLNLGAREIELTIEEAQIAHRELCNVFRKDDYVFVPNGADQTPYYPLHPVYSTCGNPMSHIPETPAGTMTVMCAGLTDPAPAQFSHVTPTQHHIQFPLSGNINK